MLGAASLAVGSLVEESLAAASLAVASGDTLDGGGLAGGSLASRTERMRRSARAPARAAVAGDGRPLLFWRAAGSCAMRGERCSMPGAGAAEEGGAADLLVVASMAAASLAVA